MKRVDHSAGVSIRLKTTNGFESLVLLDDGSTDWIPLKDMHLTIEVSIKLKTTNGPKFDPDDWIEFEAGTEECLASIQGNTRVLLKKHTCIQSFRNS